jgi:hypothetical protein
MKKSKLQKRIEKSIKSIKSVSGRDYWKWYLLPSPIELGMSDSNALGSRDFGSQPGQATWEDWEEKVKAMRPVRFFLAEEMIPWFKLKYRIYVTDPIYWVKCHTLKSHRFHMLDLRQPQTREDIKPYRYGWIDSDTKILYALFGILSDFVEGEMPHWYCPSEEDVQADPNLLSQRHKWLEAKAIHYWWTVERHRQAERHAEMLHAWSEAKKNKDPQEHQLWDELNKHEKVQDEKEDEMIARLMKIRRSLWT